MAVSVRFGINSKVAGQLSPVVSNIEKPGGAAGLFQTSHESGVKLKVDDEILVRGYFASFVHRYPGVVG